MAELRPQCLSNVTSSSFQYHALTSTTNTSLKAIAAGGAGGDNSFEGLLRVESVWESLKSPSYNSGPIPIFVNDRSASPFPSDAPLDRPEFDVIVCGGTLGLFQATALQKRGFKVAVVERGPLVGRDQEWNISRKELAPFVDFGVLTPAQLEACILSEWNPCRCGFYGAQEGDYVIVENVLNIGVSPRSLITTVRENFEKAGGRVYENTPIDGVDVYRDAVSVVHHKRDSSNEVFGPGERQVLSARLLLDCMGHASPIVRQLRWGQRPDGVCVVVGGLARGFPADNNTTSDVIFTTEHSRTEASLQYFWEAFPAGSGPRDRTTYMFTYIDTDARRPSLIDMFDDYLDRMPQYQNVQLEDLTFRRLLYGFFPTFRASPLQPGFDRVLQIGDASGIQSPLSFGGLGAMLRHMPRLVPALSEALASDSLDRASLGLVNPYLANLSATWLFQHSMSIRVGQSKPADFINRTMASNFKNMRALGPATMMPFLQASPVVTQLRTLLRHSSLNLNYLVVHFTATTIHCLSILTHITFPSVHVIHSTITRILLSLFLSSLGLLQDVVQFGSLGSILLRQVTTDPLFVPVILSQLEPAVLLDWLRHFAAMGGQQALHTAVGPSLRSYARQLPEGSKTRFKILRLAEQWEFGSGMDYHF